MHAARWRMQAYASSRSPPSSLTADLLRLPLFLVQHQYKGEEVDFVESYFFPPAKEYEAVLQQRRARRATSAAAQEREQLAA